MSPLQSRSMCRIMQHVVWVRGSDCCLAMVRWHGLSDHDARSGQVVTCRWWDPNKWIEVGASKTGYAVSARHLCVRKIRTGGGTPERMIDRACRHETQCTFLGAHYYGGDQSKWARWSTTHRERGGRMVKSESSYWESWMNSLGDGERCRYHQYCVLSERK